MDQEIPIAVPKLPPRAVISYDSEMWESKRPLIHQLYFDDSSIKEIVDILAKDYYFFTE